MTPITRRSLLLLLLLGLALAPLARWAAARPPARPGGGRVALRTVQVRPWFGTHPLRLEAPAGRTAAGEAVTISTLRFYFTGLTLQHADGRASTDPTGYHLLDADDPASWAVAVPLASEAPVVAVSLVRGTDSAANAAGALGGPLDPALGMYWAWQSGYVNVKLEGTSPVRPVAARRGFSFHVGGYRAPAATRRVVRVPLAAPDAAPEGAPTAALTLLADVARWLDAAPLAATPDVLIPGPAAAVQADRAAAIFRHPLATDQLAADAP